MAGKADFTEDEWKTLSKGVTGTGMLVSLAHKDFTDSFGEATALAKEMANQHTHNQSQLVRELGGTRRMAVRAALGPLSDRARHDGHLAARRTRRIPGVRAERRSVGRAKS